MKENLTPEQIKFLIKEKLQTPFYIIITFCGSFLWVLSISFYIHQFFNSEKLYEWLFTDILSLCFAGVFAKKTVKWREIKKGKNLMAFSLTIIIFFFWKYDLKSMLGF